jgi:mannose-6-phosphate isomerase-like protein (cupin superfamily)
LFNERTEKAMTTIAPADGERADFPGLGNRFLLRSDSTDGRFAILEHTIAPRALAAPIHTHRNEDEYSFVLAGRMGVMLGDEASEAGPGELVVKPRGIPHAFWNASDEDTRVLEVISPGGFEQYFADLAPIMNAGGPPDFAAMAEVQARYELAMDPGSIGMLVERFGLRM